MFPLSITGEFKISRLQDNDVNLVLNRVEQELAAVRATNVSRTANRITFTGGIFRFVSNWNLLVPIGYGEIEVLPDCVKYTFSCTQMLVATTVMVCIMGAFILFSAPVSAFSLITPVIIWLWLFGMNYLISAVRLPAFVRKIAHDWLA